MIWRNRQTLLGIGMLLSCACVQVHVQAKQVVHLAVEEPVKPQVNATFIPEQTTVKKQLSLQPSQRTTTSVNDQPVNDQLSLAAGYVGETSQQRTLTNDYPLTQPSRVSGKPRVKALYSENGIVSDLGVEKRKVYQYKQTNGVMVFSDQQPSHQDFQVLLYECFACRVDSVIDWYKTPLFTSPFTTDVALAARQYQLDPALIRAVIHAESAFKMRALSKVGAKGLMQLMPGTAKDMGVDDPFNAQQNIRGGSRYLAQLLSQFDGDIDLACAAYNAGPTTVMQYRGIPPYPETQAYVTRVKILLKRYQKALAS
jgi:soluble lytic murein transglycosylase-like protein